MLGLLFFCVFGIVKFYKYYKEKQEKAAYLESLVDTSSPTVSVLKDSILIGYRNEKRTIHVYVPPEYDSDTLGRYPVIYMMDGESSFNDLANMAPEWEIDEVINKASKDGKQTAIVIGIEQSENRDAEYTPFINDDNPDAHGAEYSEWVTTDLKAWVDSNFRTKIVAASTSIGGISRSGMMAYYMMMAHPDVFGNAIIQSPSMWVDHDRLFDMELNASQLEGKKIFVSVGAKEGGPMVPDATGIFNKFKKQGLCEKQLKLAIIPDEGHWHPTWRKSFALAYPWLME